LESKGRKHFRRYVRCFFLDGAGTYEWSYGTPGYARCFFLDGAGTYGPKICPMLLFRRSRRYRDGGGCEEGKSPSLPVGIIGNKIWVAVVTVSWVCWVAVVTVSWLCWVAVVTVSWVCWVGVVTVWWICWVAVVTVWWVCWVAVVTVWWVRWVARA
jgi:hypothetical protein